MGAALGGAAASPWLVATIPIASAMVAGATAGSILHWRKVCGRGAVHAGLIVTAMCVLLAAQIVRFADLAAHVRADGLASLIRGSTWSAAIAFPSVPLADLARTVPGLAAARAVIGADGVWVFVVTELALILGLAWWMAGRALRAPLCMACRAWCVRQRGVVERDGDAAAPDLVRQRIAARGHVRPVDDERRFALVLGKILLLGVETARRGEHDEARRAEHLRGEQPDRVVVFHQ